MTERPDGHELDDTSWAPATGSFLADDTPFGSVLGDPLTGSLVYDVSVLDATPGTQPEDDALHQERAHLSAEERDQVARADQLKAGAAQRRAQHAARSRSATPAGPVPPAAAYGQAPSPYVQAPYGQPGYGQPPHAQPPYGQPAGPGSPRTREEMGARRAAVEQARAARLAQEATRPAPTATALQAPPHAAEPAPYGVPGFAAGEEQAALTDQAEQAPRKDTDSSSGSSAMGWFWITVIGFIVFRACAS